MVVSTLDCHSHDAALISEFRAQREPVIIATVGADADPFMLHVHAVWAQKQRAMIAERTQAALAAKRAGGVKLGNWTNPREAQAEGTEGDAEAGDAFAAKAVLVIRKMQRAGITAPPQNLRGSERARHPDRAEGSVWLDCAERAREGVGRSSALAVRCGRFFAVPIWY